MHRYKGHHKDLMPVQSGRDYKWSGMHRPCASVCKHPTETQRFQLYGVSKGKSALMVFDRHPELQNKWNKAFGARGYYVFTVENVTEEAIKRYIQEQEEESKQEESALERQ